MLVTVVVRRPTCCRVIAPNSMKPINRKALFWLPVRGVEARADSANAKGSTVIVAVTKRNPMNRNGPIEDMAVDWATKPMPQTAPAKSKSKLACVRLMVLPDLVPRLPSGSQSGYGRAMCQPRPRKRADLRLWTYARALPGHQKKRSRHDRIS